MRERNDGTSEDNIVKNRFTAYVIKATANCKARYINSKKRHALVEVPFDFYEHEEILYEPDFLDSFSAIEQLENYRLQQVLRRVKKRDMYIFMAKVLDDRSLADIAAELGIGIHTATSAYYRVVRRLRRELGGGAK